MIWNRDGTNQKSIDGIRDIVLEKISPELKPKPSAQFYKKHSEHAGFAEVVAKAKALEDATKLVAEKNEAKIAEAEVESDEGNQALLKDAEGDTAVDAEIKKHEDGEIVSKDGKGDKAMT